MAVGRFVDTGKNQFSNAGKGKAQGYTDFYNGATKTPGSTVSSSAGGTKPAISKVSGGGSRFTPTQKFRDRVETEEEEAKKLAIKRRLKGQAPKRTARGMRRRS
jgi:hypothetical protein